MNKFKVKIVDFQEYKDKKNKSEISREELLNLLKKIVTSK